MTIFSLIVICIAILSLTFLVGFFMGTLLSIRELDEELDECERLSGKEDYDR